MNFLNFTALTLGTEVIQSGSDSVLVVQFKGQITNTNAYDINKNISLIFREEIYNLILDLSELEYINSIGVATLIGIIKTVESKSGRIMIGGLNHFLDNVIRLMDLPKKVEVYSSRKEAISNWKRN
ncbi:MAG: STAS domain-containing protein [Leptospira sp.]|nr:STAS domain-containing protein [Leptospira sp.]